MLKKLIDKEYKYFDEFIEVFISSFPIPMFYKDSKKSGFKTNEALDFLIGDNKQKVLNSIYEMNTTHRNRFELKISTDIGKEINSIVYIAKLDKEGQKKIGIIFDISSYIRSRNSINYLKQRYELATEASSEGLWDWNIKDGETFYSNKWKEIMGLSSVPVKNKMAVWFEKIFDEDKAKVAKDLEDHINQKTPIFKSEFRIINKGEQRWIAVRGKATYDENKKPERVVGFITDITQIKNAELALRDSEEQFQLFMKNLPAGAFIKDEDSNFVFSNQYMNEFFGFNLEGRNIRELTSKEIAESIIKKDKEVLIKGSDIDEETLRDKDGNIKTFQAHRFIINKDKHKLIGGIYSDITEHKKTQNKLNILAHYDILTNLPNRVLFQDRLTHSLSKAARTKTKVVLMFIDLDNFKTINDTLGHDYGDMLLVGVAKRLKEILRSEDTISRLGGDEFTIILDDVKDDTYPSIVAQKIIDTLSEPFELKNEIAYIGASIGIAIYPDDGDTKELLIKNADTAMYRAKNEGKNIFKYFTEEMNAESYEKLKLSNDLRNAIENNQLKLYYQPIVNTQKHTLIAFEALVRWEHPKLGLITPDGFINIAEEGGFMSKVGTWVLRKACQRIKIMQNANLNIKVAVNISSKQLTQNHLEETIKNLVDEIGIDPTLLELEVTESFLMENLQSVEKTLVNLKAMGINTAIDDFGTGYSSLSYLKKLPISKLKIDKSFIDDIPYDLDDMEIASTIISMAKQLSLEVIAEGVETEEQIEFLKSKGCYNMQGYYFSKAIAENKLNDFLRANSLGDF